MADRRVYEGNGHRAVIEDPENITWEECWVLAKCGSKAWNSWRREFPVRVEDYDFVNAVDFSNRDFRETDINFFGCEFGDSANFQGAQFGYSDKYDKRRFKGQVSFECASFGRHANFVHTKFECHVSFNDAQFGSRAKFHHAVFRETSSFSRTQFADDADFGCALFIAGVNFAGARFDTLVDFRNVIFANEVVFRGAQFAEMAYFDAAQFNKSAQFEGVQMGHRARFVGAHFLDKVNFDGWPWAALRSVYYDSFEERRLWADERGLSPQSFDSIVFDGARFDGQLSFQDRVFDSITSFSSLKEHLNVRRLRVNQHNWPALDENKNLVFDTRVIPKGQGIEFKSVPVFHGSKFHQNITFESARFPNACGEEASARAYRTLKLAFAQQQAIREEQRFFKLEMEEEAARETGWKRWLYRVYSLTSDYGFSVWRPFLALVLMPCLIALLIYSALALSINTDINVQIMADQTDLMSKWLQFGLVNMVPFPDSELLKDLRDALFSSQGSAVRTVAVVVESLQKLLALIGYFLIGLALRNLFKMK
jgi:uncharacterized protein YjbI with pentapeptide repeats